MYIYIYIYIYIYTRIPIRTYQSPLFLLKSLGFGRPPQNLLLECFFLLFLLWFCIFSYMLTTRFFPNAKYQSDTIYIYIYTHHMKNRYETF